MVPLRRSLEKDTSKKREREREGHINYPVLLSKIYNLNLLQEISRKKKLQVL